jgi:hypothetical protein
MTFDYDMVPDEAIAARGGLLQFPDLRQSAERCRERYGYYGLSVFADVGVTLDELLVAANIRHGHIARTTAALLRQARFEVCRTGRAPHATVILGATVDEDTIRRFVDAFSPPEPNPIQ